jgi:hypothetical protein
MKTGIGLAHSGLTQMEGMTMSYPYPQDRHRDRKEKGEQPYKDAKESMSQQDARLRSEEMAYVEEHHPISDEERIEQLEADANERLAEINDELRKEQEKRLLGTGDAGKERSQCP